jgi:hypothetical protein
MKNIKQRSNDTEQQNLFANTTKRRSLISHCDTKLETAKKQYAICCTRNGSWVTLLRLVFRNCEGWVKDMRNANAFYVEKKMLYIQAYC